MFASLKNKIKEETGSDVATDAVGPQRRISNTSNNNRIRSRFSSQVSVSSTDDGGGGGGTGEYYMAEQLSTLRSQCNELTTKVSDLTARLHALQEEKTRTEKTNEILLETVKVAQTQKDIYCEEQEKVQHIQHAEIEKLKSLLSFREQEAVDRLATLRQNQQQIENLTGELERLKKIEPMVEDLQDDLERLRHSSQLGKNNLTTTLAAVEEENRHLKTRLQIVEKARLETIATLGTEEKIQALVHERKLLEQHLEEAHLQLSDIKSSWSGQNLALETQVSRLSNQVAEETTEKRKVLKARDEMVEKVKALEFDMMKMTDDLRERDEKIRLLEDEVTELNRTLKECREEADQQVVYERNKVASLETTTQDLQSRLQAADERFTEYAANSEQVAQTLRLQNTKLQQELLEAHNAIEHEREEKLTALLRNAEISQSEELLKKELRVERDDSNDLHEKNEDLEQKLKSKQLEADELRSLISTNTEKIKTVDDMQRELNEKNKANKILNQRLTDMKKTLQKEFRSSKSYDESIRSSQAEKVTLENGIIPSPTTTQSETAIISTTSSSSSCSCTCAHHSNVNNATTNPSGGLFMDEVNFKYLKHVIVKFLTSREVEARHLICAVATLLKLNKDEEKLLHDTLNWKMSWFGSKPDHGTGQRAFSIPPS